MTIEQDSCAVPQRRVARQVAVRRGARWVTLGGDAPVLVQSMTNIDTADAIATAIQVKELAAAGSELVRITVNTPEAPEPCRTVPPRSISRRCRGSTSRHPTRPVIRACDSLDGLLALDQRTRQQAARIMRGLA